MSVITGTDKLIAVLGHGKNAAETATEKDMRDTAQLIKHGSANKKHPSTNELSSARQTERQTGGRAATVLCKYNASKYGLPRSVTPLLMCWQSLSRIKQEI